MKTRDIFKKFINSVKNFFFSAFFHQYCFWNKIQFVRVVKEYWQNYVIMVFMHVTYSNSFITVYIYIYAAGQYLLRSSAWNFSLSCGCIRLRLLFRFASFKFLWRIKARFLTVSCFLFWLKRTKKAVLRWTWLRSGIRVENGSFVSCFHALRENSILLRVRIRIFKHVHHWIRSTIYLKHSRKTFFKILSFEFLIKFFFFDRTWNRQFYSYRSYQDSESSINDTRVATVELP